MKNFFVSVFFLLILFSFAIYNTGVPALILNAISIISFLLLAKNKKYNLDANALIEILIIYSSIFLLFFYWSSNELFNLNEFIRSFSIFFVYSFLFIVFFDNYENFSNNKNIIQIYKIFILVNFALVIFEFLLQISLNIKLIFPWQSPRYTRISGIMSEPSQNATLCFPLLFDDKMFTTTFKILIMTSLLLLTASGSFLVLYIFFLFSLINKTKLTVTRILSLSIIILLLIFLISNLDLANLKLFERVSRIGIDDPSSFTRFFKGFILFENNDLVNNLLGNGLGNSILTVSRYSGEYYHLVNLEGEMMSGVFANIFSYGLPLALFIYYFMYKKLKIKKMQDILIILFVFTLFSGTSFTSYIFYNLMFISSLIRNFY